jgi:hypothetical protein
MTAHRARRVLGLLLVATVVAFGGCGADEKAEYKEDAKAIIDPLRKTLNTTNERVGAASSQRERTAELAKTRRAVETAADKLEKLDPPAEAQTEHDNFVAQLHRFAKDIRAFERAAQGDDRRAVRRALVKLRADTARLKAANDALKEKVNG